MSRPHADYHRTDSGIHPSDRRHHYELYHSGRPDYVCTYDPNTDYRSALTNWPGQPFRVHFRWNRQTSGQLPVFRTRQSAHSEYQRRSEASSSLSRTPGSDNPFLDSPYSPQDSAVEPTIAQQLSPSRTGSRSGSFNISGLSFGDPTEEPPSPVHFGSGGSGPRSRSSTFQSLEEGSSVSKSSGAQSIIPDPEMSGFETPPTSPIFGQGSFRSVHSPGGLSQLSSISGRGRSDSFSGEPGPVIEPEEEEVLEGRGYNVVGVLGTGIQGDVFKATCGPDVPFQLKVEQGESHEAFIVAIKRYSNKQRGQTEGEIMMLFDHKHVVRAHDAFEAGNRYFIVMEYLNASNAFNNYRDNMKKSGQPLDESTALLIMKHMLLGLQHIHSLGYIHGDVHLDNAMAHITHDEQLVFKIGDFGFTRELTDQNWHIDFPRRDSNSFFRELLQSITGTVGQRIGDVIAKIGQPGYNSSEKITVRLLTLMPTDDTLPEGSLGKDFLEQFKP